MLECNGIIGFDCTPNEFVSCYCCCWVWKHKWKWNKVFNGKLLNPGFEEHEESNHLSWKQSKASHKPSLLLFSCNTVIITECVVGWFFGAKHFGHFVRSFLFLIDEAIPRMPANNKNIRLLYCKSRSVNCAQSFEVVEVHGGQE
jgi:hypothetical protein